MATKQQSFWQNYKSIALKSLLGLAVIGLFSYFGAAYLNASHAETPGTVTRPTAPYQGIKLTSPPYKILKTVDYTGMKPYTGPGLVIPSTVMEALDTSNPRIVPYGQTVYQIPSTNRPGVNSHLSFVTTEGISTFHVNPSRLTGYQICAAVRRDQSASAEGISITIPGRNLTNSYVLPGSQYYRYLCTKTFMAEANVVPGYDINGRVSNDVATHALRVAYILLVQTTN